MRTVTNFVRRVAILAAIQGLLGAATLVAQTNRTVTLAWEPSPEADVAGYIVHYGNASGAYPSATNVGNVNLATIGGLREGLTYFFVVTAYDTSGLQSDLSNEVNYTPLPGSTPATNGPIVLGWELVAPKAVTLNFRQDLLLNDPVLQSGGGPLYLAGLDRRSRAFGWLQISSAGDISYRPPTNNYTGTDSFTYTLTNGAGTPLVRTGIVQVVATPQPIAVRMTQPAARLLVSVGADVPLAAAVTDTNNAVGRVEFYANKALIASSSAPSSNVFSGVWSKVASGSYMVSATAYATNGQVIGSTPCALSVVCLPDPSGFANAVVEASSDNTHWVVIQSYVYGKPTQAIAPLAGVPVVETDPTAPMRFYRLRQTSSGSGL